MLKVSSRLLVGMLALIFLISGCRVLTRATSTRIEASPNGKSQLPAPTATLAGNSPGVLIPITGENVVYMQCQFCVGDQTHAVLVFPEAAYFDVSEPSSASCLTADVVNGRRIIICRGPQATSFNLSICSDLSNCLQFPVVLQPCALLKNSVTSFNPVYLTPIPKHKSNNGSDPTPPQEGAPSAPPPEPINEPRPTQEPKPTKEPRPTKEPHPTHEPKPTKKPKPGKP